MRKLAGAHHLGFDKGIERRLLTCSDESSSKTCVHRSTMSGGSGLALSDGSWSFLCVETRVIVDGGDREASAGEWERDDSG